MQRDNATQWSATRGNSWAAPPLIIGCIVDLHYRKFFGMYVGRIDFDGLVLIRSKQNNRLLIGLSTLKVLNPTHWMAQQDTLGHHVSYSKSHPLKTVKKLANNLWLHTSHGDLKIEVFCELVPKTAENFLALCASGQYNGTPFHRMIPDFMVQGGDTSLSPNIDESKAIPKGGSSIYGQFFEDEIKTPALRHSGRGMVSMANKGPGTNASQFFITFKEAPHLDGKNTVFGRVIDGTQEGGALEHIEAVEVDKKYRPKSSKIVLERVTIHANPLAS